MPQIDRTLLWLPLVCVLFASGCANHTQEGALAGGLFGTGAGAIIGQACGNPLAGAAVGAVAGTAIGASAGGQQDEVDARTREFIAQQMGRQLSAGGVTNEDVIGMTRASVREDLIVNQVRTHGIARPLQSQDVIYLQQQGVSPQVIATMQAAPQAQSPAVIVQQPVPQPVIVETYPAYWGPRPYPHPPGYW